jgi:hypothetical protein
MHIKPVEGQSIAVDGASYVVARVFGDEERRCIVALEPGIYVVAVRLEDGTWTAKTGEPANDEERAALKALVDTTRDTLSVTQS